MTIKTTPVTIKLGDGMRLIAITAEMLAVTNENIILVILLVEPLNLHPLVVTIRTASLVAGCSLESNNSGKEK